MTKTRSFWAVAMKDSGDVRIRSKALVHAVGGPTWPSRLFLHTLDVEEGYALDFWDAEDFYM